jgi:hypothetical protein
MPYSYQLQNRRRLERAKKAAPMAVLLALFILALMAPAQMQGWPGLGWGNLFGPPEKAEVEEQTAPLAAPVRATVSFSDHLGMPVMVEATSAGCFDCEGSSWAYNLVPEPGVGWLSKLEESAGAALSTPWPGGGTSSASGVGPASGSRSNRGRSAASGGGGGGGGGGGSPSSASDDQSGDTGTEPVGSSEVSESPAGSPAGGTQAGASNDGQGSSPSGASSTSNPQSLTSNPQAPDGAVAAGGPARPENLLLSPMPAAGDSVVSPFAPSDSSGSGDVPDEVLKAVADSAVGGETIYSQGDATKLADAVGLDPATAQSDRSGVERVDLVPEPASVTLIGIALAGALSRRRRTQS